MNWPALSAEVVLRRPPANLDTRDEGLFRHEYEKSFPAVSTYAGSWDSTPEGMLLAVQSSRLEERWFQGGHPKGVSGGKARAKALWARVTLPRTELSTHRMQLIISDEFSNGYFHWLTDALPKLWWLRDSLEQFCVVLPTFAHRFRYMTESLALWPELESLILPRSSRTHLSDATLVPALAPTGNYRPDLMLGLAAEWRNKVRPAAPQRRIYVSRAKAPLRRIRNEDEVWSLLQARGFERVFLEDLRFEEQVKLLGECELLVSNHGAGLTNLLFQLPATRVLEIRLRGDGANNCYYSLANAVGVEYHYLLADSADGDRDSHKADLFVDVAKLTALVGNLTVKRAQILLQNGEDGDAFLRGF